MGAPALTLSLDELWTIRDYVRQFDKHGAEWDKEFERRLFKAMGEAEEHKQADLPIESEAELWQIHRQVPSTIMVGTEPVGQRLLRKVQKAILAWGETGTTHDDDQPTITPLPDFVNKWNEERARAEKEFEDYVHDASADADHPDYCS